MLTDHSEVFHHTFLVVICQCREIELCCAVTFIKYVYFPFHLPDFIDPTADEHQVAFFGCWEDIVPNHDVKDKRLPVRTDQDVALVRWSWLMFDFTMQVNANPLTR